MVRQGGGEWCRAIRLTGVDDLLIATEGREMHYVVVDRPFDREIVIRLAPATYQNISGTTVKDFPHEWMLREGDISISGGFFRYVANTTTLRYDCSSQIIPPKNLSGIWDATKLAFQSILGDEVSYVSRYSR